MAKLKRYLQFRNLAQYRTYIQDTEPNSRFFRLAQLSDKLTLGKNAFLINGSPELEPTTEVLIEIIDSAGNTVFQQPIPNYAEGLARVVSIEVYPDTGVGPATMTILGELRQDANGNPIPAEWQNKYNIKYTKTFTIDPTAACTSPIRLYNIPTMDVHEHILPYHDTTLMAKSITSGSVTGSSLYNVINVGNQFPNTYIIQTSAPILSKSMEGGTVTASFGTTTFTASLDYVLSNTVAFLDTSYISGNLYLPFNSTNFTINYQDLPQYGPTQYSRSYAHVIISNLTVFSGHIDRSKLYVRSVDTTNQVDFQQFADLTLEAADLLSTHSLTGLPTLRQGNIINQAAINSYWVAGIPSFTTGYLVTGSVNASYNDSVLMSSMHIGSDANLQTTGSLIPQYFIGTNAPLTFHAAMEYEYYADIFCQKSTNSFDAILEVYISGSAFPNTNPLGQLITSYICPLGTTQLLVTGSLTNTNFIAPITGSGYLNFVIYGGDWYIGNVGVFSAFADEYSPDEVEFVTPIDQKRLENIQFKASVYDIEGSTVGIDILSPIIFWQGSNVFIKGIDNRLQGTLTITSGGVAQSGIILSAIGYTASAGTPVSGASVIYIGQGTHFNSNTAFLVATGTTGPVFSIADKLTYQTGSLEILAANFIVSTSTLVIDSTLNSGTIKLGSAIDMTTGSGIYMDGYGNFRVGNTTSSSLGYIQFDSNTGIVSTKNLKADAGTLSNVTIISTTSGSRFTGTSISSSIGIFGSVIIDGARFTNADRYNTFVVYSASIANTSYEMGRFGYYTKVKGGSQQISATTSSINVGTGSINGGLTYHPEYTIQSIVAITVPTTASFLNNIVQLSETIELQEFNAISVPYGAEYIAYASCSWCGSFDSSGGPVQTTSSSITDNIAVFSGIQTSDFSEIVNLTVPPNRGGANLLYIKTSLTINPNQGAA